MNHPQSEHPFEPLTRTSLQSFRFLSQNLCIAHPVRAGEITRTSLQSLMKVPVYAFYFVLFEVHDCDLHTADDLFCIVSDTRVPDEHLAIAYSWLYARIDAQMVWKILF
jgi:hypothetical protein